MVSRSFIRPSESASGITILTLSSLINRPVFQGSKSCKRCYDDAIHLGELTKSECGITILTLSSLINRPVFRAARAANGAWQRNSPRWINQKRLRNHNPHVEQPNKPPCIPGSKSYKRCYDDAIHLGELTKSICGIIILTLSSRKHHLVFRAARAANGAMTTQFTSVN